MPALLSRRPVLTSRRARLASRRAVLAGFGGLLVPLAARADVAALAEAARREGTLTWYISQVDSEAAEMLGRSFTAAYPGVQVLVIRATGQVIFQRLMQDIRNQTPNCDVFSTSDISHMPNLKDRGALSRFVPQNAAALTPPFRALSDEGLYYVTNAGRYFMIHNTDKVRAADAPRRWTDLLDPKWKNRLAVAHPAFSGGTSVWVLTLKKRFGWSYFEALARNNPRIGRSAVDPVTLLSGGECLVAATWGPAAYRGMDKGNPIAIDHPADGTVALAFPSGIPANAPHPNAARLFMEWLLSEPYSRIIAADGSEPLRADVAARKGSPGLDDGSVIELSVDEIRAGVPEVIEQWRETFGG